MKVLIADDDRDLLDLIAFTLSQAGYLAVKATDGTTALALFASEEPDLLVLDINMPGASGFKVCETIRTQSAVPIMMLTARDEEEDLVRSLELGADDYLTQPFSPRTLLARIKALMRRAGMENSGPLASGRVKLNVEDHTVEIGAGDAVRLTKLELRLLQMLLVNAGRHGGIGPVAGTHLGPPQFRRPAAAQAAGPSPAAENRKRSIPARVSADRHRGGLQADGGIAPNPAAATVSTTKLSVSMRRMANANVTP